jgi:ribosomal protein L33
MGKEILKIAREDEAGKRIDSENSAHEAAATANRANPADKNSVQEPAQPAASGGHGECTAAGQINYLTDGLSDLRARMAKLEVLLLSIETQAQNSGARDVSKDAVHQITNIARQIEVLNEGLRTTPDYNLGKTFNCASCSSNGTIAIKVRCTSCGKENWWGYWPKKNNAEK